MSFNGLGTFVINSAGQPVVIGTTITDTEQNLLTADLATGLSTTICKDGQSTTTASIPFALGLSSASLLDISGAVAGQIKFPSTQNPSSNANTLDDYIEFTWTPTLTANSGSATYSNNSGFGVKIGQWVYLSFDITLTSVGSLSGPTVIDGLPYTVKNSVNSRGTCAIHWANMTTPLYCMMGRAINNTTTAELKCTAGAVTSISNVAASDLSATTALNGTIIYQATA